MNGSYYSTAEKPLTAITPLSDFYVTKRDPDHSTESDANVKKLKYQRV